MSKFDQFKLFCTIQLQNIDQREIQLRKELQEIAIQREYLTEFMQELHGPQLTDPLAPTESEIEIFKSLLIKVDIE